MPRDLASATNTMSNSRLDAIDLLRGSVMVLMALDHTRAFFSNPGFDPLDLSKTSAALFLTRWVTHFCAPVFVFLAGTGAFLAAYRGGKTKPQLAWFLLSRGVWLLVLEFTLVHLGWAFSLDYRFLLGQVIWAIGWSMILLAGLVFLPTWVVGLLGVLIIAGHNAFDPIQAEKFGLYRSLWVALVSGGKLDFQSGLKLASTAFPILHSSISLTQPGFLIVAYPILPWLGVMAAGYAFGTIWLVDPGRRQRWLVFLGTSLIVLFITLRAFNKYGDPNHWSPQRTGEFTVLSFLNCTKYPPSLLFVLMTLGPAILTLAWFDRSTVPLGRQLTVFGRVPLFYYLLHVPTIHLAAIVFAGFRHGTSGFLYQHPLFRHSDAIPKDYGYDLPVVYVVWIGVVVSLYPACKWFAGVKSRRRSAWLSYS
jgi:uncharacterized membrane protein